MHFMGKDDTEATSNACKALFYTTHNEFEGTIHKVKSYFQLSRPC